MFDPMPQPKPALKGFKADIDRWRRDRRRDIAKRVFAFIVLVVSLALIGAFVLQYTGVMCNV